MTPRPTRFNVAVARRPLFIGLAALALAACGTGQAAAPPSGPPTVAGVGSLPEPLATAPAPASTQADTTDPVEQTTRSTTRRTTTTDAGPTTTDRGRSTLPLGRLVDGNRVLMIGDSILASTAERYDGEMCASLVPLGWAVEIDAETGREIEFGNDVLDRRLDAGWDAAVVFLGNNYPSTPEAFAAELRRIVERLEPRPTIVVTVSEWDRRQAEVNYIVRSLPTEYGHVRVVDWAAQTAADDGLTRGDDLHPTDSGRRTLTYMISGVLGTAPRDADWRPTCLPTEFTDDTN